MKGIYCRPCRQMLRAGEAHCPTCGGSGDHACVECHRDVAVGSSCCEACAGESGRPRPAPALLEVVPDLDRAAEAALTIPAAVLGAKPVLERYEAGRHGVKATVVMAGEDAAILNELLQFVAMLHAMAARSNQFRGHTDNTRKMIRQMRDLATLIQEEVELRRGPQ